MISMTARIEDYALIGEARRPRSSVGLACGFCGVTVRTRWFWKPSSPPPRAKSSDRLHAAARASLACDAFGGRKTRQRPHAHRDEDAADRPSVWLRRCWNTSIAIDIRELAFLMAPSIRSRASTLRHWSRKFFRASRHYQRASAFCIRNLNL